MSENVAWPALIVVSCGLYALAPGLGVLMAIGGVVAIVVYRSREQDRVDRERAERLREAARRW